MSYGRTIFYSLRRRSIYFKLYINITRNSINRTIVQQKHHWYRCICSLKPSHRRCCRLKLDIIFEPFAKLHAERIINLPSVFLFHCFSWSNLISNFIIPWGLVNLHSASTAAMRPDAMRLVRFLFFHQIVTNSYQNCCPKLFFTLFWMKNRAKRSEFITVWTCDRWPRIGNYGTKSTILERSWPSNAPAYNFLFALQDFLLSSLIKYYMT